MRCLLTALCAFSFSSAALAQPIAFDSFESGTLSGGSGWHDASWQSNAIGSILVHDQDGAPVYDGSYHVRITNNNTYLWRSADLAGQSNLVLFLAYKSTSASNYSRVWIDDGTPRLVLDTIPPDSNYHTLEVPLEPSEYKNGLIVKLGNEGPSKRALLYFDDIQIRPYVPPVPVVVTLSSPADGAMISGVDSTLGWSADGPADNYHLTLDDNSDFSSPIVDDSSLVDSMYPVSGLVPNTTYYWKVRAYSGGTWWNWSPTSQFTTSSPTANSFVVEAEDFTSCVDKSADNGSLIYRMDVDADISYDHDPFFYEGYRVHIIEQGESLTYTINVPATDTWNITFNGLLNFNLYFDGQLYASNIGLEYRPGPVTDFWTNHDLVVSGVPLSAGTHTMKIVANQWVGGYSDMQLDYIWFASATNPPAPLPTPTKPYNDTVAPAPPAGYTSPVARYGDLYVDGPHLRSGNTGDIARLRGVALSSPKWWPTIPKNTIYNLAYHENVQLIRLAMYAESGTYDDPSMQEYLQAKTLEVIEEAIDAGIYVELSYHTHATDFSIGGGAYQLERGFYQWLLAQPVVASQPPNLIFGIVNEVAASNISWAQVKPYAQSFVDLIRATHQNVISCGTPYWSQHPQDVIGNELAGGNVVYTFHMYTGAHAMSVADNLVAAYEGGVPVWANELSPGSYDWTSWQYNFANFDNLVSLLETRGLGWVNWNWTVKGEALSAFKWYSQYYGPWQASDFTEGGLYIRDKLASPWPALTTRMDLSALSASCVVAGTSRQVKFAGTVMDEQLRGVSGASVSYTITGGSGSTATDTGGAFSVLTAKSRKPITATFTVQGLSASGYQDDDALFAQSRTVTWTCQ